jgi:GNAT superfamily N-acetyltransferase
MMSGEAGDVLRMAAARFEDPDAQALVAEVQEEYTLRYGGPDSTPLEPGTFDPPRGAFFLGRVDGVPVAMGGWRRRSDVPAFGRSAAAEVKRMYVAPAARRRGFARLLLGHLEETAREAGADLMVLETGSMQPEAIAMYTAAGYQRIADFGHYSWSPLVRCFGKPL